MLEREREIEQLDQVLLQARAGAGSLVVLSGEAGSGKSTLLAHTEGRARAAGMHVLCARGLELEAGFAFGSCHPYLPVTFEENYIDVLELPFEDALQMTADGRIADAKTILLLQWAALRGPFAR